MKYTYKEISDIIDSIDNETSRWDSILELKTITHSKYLPDFILASSHKNWVIRWVVVEQLSQFNHPNVMIALVSLIDDPDPHVRKNVTKAIKKYGVDIAPILLQKLLHNHYRIRLIVKQILASFSDDVVPILVSHIRGKNWIIDNHLLHILLLINPRNITEILLSLLPIISVQKNCLVILKDTRPVKSIQIVVSYYSQYSFRTCIFNYLESFPKKVLFSKLISIYLIGSTTLSNSASLILIRVGEPFLPYLLTYIKKYPQYVNKILLLIEKIGPELIIRDIHDYAKLNYSFAQKTRLLRQKYPSLN